MSRVEIDEGAWESRVLAGWDRLAQEKLGPDIAEDARRYAHEVTGELKASIDFQLKEGHVLEVRASAPYAAYVELGTRPHIIRPHDRPRGGFIGDHNPGPFQRGGHSLRWFEGGEPIFAWLVHHPGSKPYPYLRPALFTERGG
jgi:hypothetical protein